MTSFLSFSSVLNYYDNSNVCIGGVSIVFQVPDRRFKGGLRWEHYVLPCWLDTRHQERASALKRSYETGYLDKGNVYLTTLCRTHRMRHQLFQSMYQMIEDDLLIAQVGSAKTFYKGLEIGEIV